jgi:glycosyltransferase involved in cell wall biosynthesis
MELAISVIIPVYNTEAYLQRCVDSVLAQEGVSLEVILVDDGSTDASPALCDRYAAQHPQVRVIHSPNGGPATAKNLGLDIARGLYISFIDSDDTIYPSMYREMLAPARANEADIVCCGYSETDEQGHLSPRVHTGECMVMDRDEAMRRFLVRDRIYSQCWTKIYRRAWLEEHGIRNTPGLKTDEDHIFNLYAFLEARTVCVVDKPLYVYTNRSSSLSKDYYKKHIDRMFANMTMRLELVDRLVGERMPQLRAFSTRHCLRYYNELLGRVALFPAMYGDARVKNIFRYFRMHRGMLWRERRTCGLSAIGVILILILPAEMYLKYRKRRG